MYYHDNDNSIYDSSNSESPFITRTWGTKLKGRSARTRTIEVKKAVPYSNASHVITPRSWLNRKVYCLTQEKYDDIRSGGRMKDGIVIEIATAHGNASHVVVTRSWPKKWVWCMVEEEYNELKNKRRERS